MISPPLRLLRSVLFIPASNERAVQKAPALKADALIFDLEDAVGPAEKQAALSLLVETLAKENYVTQTLSVRLDPLNADEIVDAILPFLRSGLVRAVVVPKVRKSDDLIRLAGLLPPHTRLWAMIETAASVVNLKDISALAETLPLEALILGPNDLRAELRLTARPDRSELSHVSNALVLHARAFGLFALDGVYNHFKDIDGFSTDCTMGRGVGFDGKTLIHPSQVAPCEAAFAPSEAEKQWALAVTAAFDTVENQDAGVISMGGEMIERLHLERARAILAAGV